MAEFIQAILSFPTVIFTGLTGLVFLYWIFVIVGAADIDLLDPSGHADALADGAADALADGAAHALADGAADAAVDGAADAVADGAADAAAHAADGAAEAGAGAAHDAGGHDPGILSALRLRQAPVTVVLSMLVTWAWLLSFLAMYFLRPILGAGVLVGLGVFAASLAGAVPLTSIALRPFGRLFDTQAVEGRDALIGRTAFVSTGRVDASFGQANYDDGGAGMILSIRCEKPNELKRGDEVLIIGYDRERHVFDVEPLAPMLEAGRAAARDPLAKRDAARAKADAEKAKGP